MYIVGVEASSCTEGLKVLLDYKQRQYAEGKVLRWCVCGRDLSVSYVQTCRQWTMNW